MIRTWEHLPATTKALAKTLADRTSLSSLSDFGLVRYLEQETLAYDACIQYKRDATVHRRYMEAGYHACVRRGMFK